jgi:L-asparagine oxygenase
VSVAGAQQGSGPGAGSVPGSDDGSGSAALAGSPEVCALPEEESRALAAWCGRVGAAVYGDGYRAAADAVAGRLGELPPSYLGALRRFRGAPGAGGLLIRGVTVPADLPPTPGRPFTELRRPVGTEPLLMAAVAVLGEIVSFADWHGGDRVQNFYPLREQAAAQNANNAVHLDLHTETAFRPDTPELVALLCLRADPDVATLYCDLGRIWRRLGPDTRAELTDPAFFFVLPDGGSTPGRPIAVPGGRGASPRFHYAQAVVAAGGAHRRALEELRTCVEQDIVPVRLARGDLLVLDNTRVVHGRSAIGARYDGTDRWMQRCLGRWGGGGARSTAEVR